MKHPRFFVSDLDGTLLQPGSFLSDFARESLTGLIHDGLPFTVATARSIISMREVLGDLPLQLPVVCGNGAYLSDPDTGQHIMVNALPGPLSQELLALVNHRRLQPFVISFDGTRDLLYHTPAHNLGMQWYQEERTRNRDPRLRPVSRLDLPAAEQVICLNLIDRFEPLQAFAAELEERFSGEMMLYLYENWYDDQWFWLSVYHTGATKARATLQLIEGMGYRAEQLTFFGDGNNDLSLMEVAGHGVAMENAKPGVKALSKEVIGPNWEDSVVKYLLKATADAGLRGW